MAKSKKRKTRADKAGSKKRWSGPLILSLRLLLWLIVLGSLVLALQMGARGAWYAVAGHPSFSVTAENVSFDTPDYIRKKNVEAELRGKLADVLSDANIFDRTLAGAVKKGVSQWPPIIEVREVRRLLPNQIRIEVFFRRPAGTVERGSEHFLIDRDGHLLPEEFYREPVDWQGRARPVIVHENLSLPGEWRWREEEALAVGARLSRFLEERGALEFLDIKEIDVTHVGRRGLTGADVSLVTGGGAIIGWGTTEEYRNIGGLKEQRRVDEPSDEKKLRELGGFLREHSGLKGIRHLDMRFNRITYDIPED